jgi:hypothetical protein
LLPFDFSPGAQNKPYNFDPEKVTSLRLEFSRAADYGRIDRLFDPAIKNQIDPQSYVVKRLDSVFHEAINNGRMTILSDQDGQVTALTAAYHVYDNESPGPDEPHNYTELGTSLATFGGYKSAQLVIAALALREWWQAPPTTAIVADIKKTNIPSIKAYEINLGWQEIADRTLDLKIDIACDRTLVEEKDKAAPRKLQFPNEPTSASWYECRDKALATQAQILLTYMALGGLINGRTGHKLPVDFSALDQEGLTKLRLEALAAGETSRERLRQIDGPAP